MDGIGGGLINGARIGDDFATGSGMFDEPEGVTSIGGGTLVGGSGSNGGCGTWTGDACEAGMSGGCGASGSGTRSFASAASGTGSGGTTVGVVSTRLDVLFLSPSTVSFEILGSDPVVGSAGGTDRCSIGAISASWSVLPLRKTLACGLAMITRGGAGTRPEAVDTGPDAAVEPGRLGGVAGSRAGTSPVSGGAALPEENVVRKGDVFDAATEPVTGGATGRGTGVDGSTSGSVLAREPVNDADCLSCDGVGPTKPVGGRVGFCIGCVTAVDQAGGLPAVGPLGRSWSDDFIGIVAAVPAFARDNCVESGFRGRGGRVTRNVSRFWGGCSAEGWASSAIMKIFYR